MDNLLEMSHQLIIKKSTIKFLRKGKSKQLGLKLVLQKMS